MAVSAEPVVDYLTRYPLLHTRDLDESRAVMGELWGKHEVEITGRVPFETLVNHVEIGQMGLTYVRCPTPLLVRCTVGGDRFTVFLHEEGTAEHTLNAESAIAAPSSAVIVVPGQEARMDSGAVRLLALDFPCVEVEQALLARGLPTAHFEQWARHRDLTSPAGETLRSLARWAAREVDRPGTPLAGGAAAEHLDQTLFSLFLACIAEPFPAQAVPAPMLGKLKLCDLEGWILANLEQPLSVDVLATLTQVSPRAVQLAFRHHRHCTPMEFIRRARLNAIHQHLLARGEAATVTTIAMKFGFFHLGHFAEAYRREFGERPAETLQRLRRPFAPGADRTRD
jgi:AraC-like DNA-binding protein